jgi:hypothetical protein
VGNPEPDKQETRAVLATVKEKYEGMRRLDPQALIEQAIAKESGIEILERLFALAKDIRGEQAREKWNEAMAEFQKNCPTIVKNEDARITTRTGGGFTYSYASLDGILSVIQPVMNPLGLSISWRNRIEPGKVVANCRVSHDLGHFEESGEVAMPIQEMKDSGDIGASAPQRVGIALTYAKRYSLLSIIGLAPEDDPDAREGDDKPPVKMPKRASEAQAAPSPKSEWSGRIAIVKTHAGETAGKPWTKFVIVGKDGQEFFTFDTKIADFAREAGASPVFILWEPGKKGGQMVVSIEPGDETE